MFINKAGRKSQEIVTYRDNEIENCNTFKYLGILLQSSGKFSECFKNLYHRGLKDVFKLTRSFKGISPSYDTCLHLFDSMVKPIISYGSDFWGLFLMNGKDLDFKRLLKSDIEKCHKNI